MAFEILEGRTLLATIVVNNLTDTPEIGKTTLREAIDVSASGDTITFDSSIFATPQTILLDPAKGSLKSGLFKDLTITGPGANLLTIDGQNGVTIFLLGNEGNVSISGLTLAHGLGNYGGAINGNFSDLTLTNCELTSNHATVAGGAVYNYYRASTLVGCTFADNTADFYGGAVAGVGGSLAIVNCTVANNSSGSLGGGLYNESSMILTNSTIAGNSASGDGGGIYHNAGSLTLNNTIVANNAPGGDIAAATPLAASHSLIGDAGSAGGLVNLVNGNLVGVDPKLGPLQFNGGPTLTMALLPGSPAFNGGDNSLVPAGITTDQRGAPRIKDDIVDMGAFAAGQQTILVTTLDDPELAPAMSLRSAINYVNTISPVDGNVIAFAKGLTGKILLGDAGLKIAGNVSISGPGAGLLTIDGIDVNPGESMLSVEAGFTVDLYGVTLVNGTGSQGGAIKNLGSLRLINCDVTGNTASNLGGSALNYGSLTVIGCTFSANTALEAGGAIQNFGTLAILDSTISDNVAPQGGGISNSSGTTTSINNTIFGNSGTFGGGIFANVSPTSPPPVLYNSIVAGSTEGGDISGPVTGNNNLIGDAASAGGLVNGVNGNVVGVDPKLGPLQYNGGPTKTRLPTSDSPAIDAGDTAFVPVDLTTDQRGGTRVFNDLVDIGAVERQATNTIVVTTLEDEDNSTPDPLIGRGTSLREAIAFANADPGGGDTISFAPYLQGTIALSLGALPKITADMTIAGPGANLLTIDGQGTGEILLVDFSPAGIPITVNLSGLTLAHGNFRFGGAIGLYGGSTLTVSGCTFSGSSASAGGGAILNHFSTLTMIGCTLAGNSAGLFGGGIENLGGTLSMVNCTLAKNISNSLGGGIYNEGTLTVTSCTIAENTALNGGGGGGGIYNFAQATLYDTIVAKNDGLDVLNNGTISGSHNLVQDGGDGLPDTIKADPLLGPLAWNGGPTQTMALLAGSPALGTGAFVGVTVDQRGFPVNSPPDIGSFQYQGTAPIASMTGPDTAIALSVVTFTLTATATPPDPNGTYTYTVDWKGDGTDVDTYQGPASIQVGHAFQDAGSYTPILTVLDPLGRASNPFPLAAPVVVSPLTPTSMAVNLQLAPLVIQPVTTVVLSHVIEIVNDVTSASWANANQLIVNTQVANSGMWTISPTSNLANIRVEPAPVHPFQPVKPAQSPLSLALDGADEEPDWLKWTKIALTTAALVVMTGGAALAFAPAEVAPLVLAFASIGVTPGFQVERGNVTISNALITTNTDSPALILKGGTLTLKNCVLMANPAGSNPIIDVSGGTLILGDPEGGVGVLGVGPVLTGGNAFAGINNSPFINVTGTGQVIDLGFNGYAQFLPGAQNFVAAATTSTQVVSSSPTAKTGQTVTFTATVNSGGSPVTGGSVGFLDKSTSTFLGQAPVVNGVAELEVVFDTPTAGDTIIATYNPELGSLVQSTGEVTQVVQASTTTDVTSSLASPSYGQSVTFTATITNGTSNGETPTGTVAFYDGATFLGDGTALSGSDGQATSTFTTSTLAPGPHHIRAVYTASGLFAGSEGTLDLTVGLPELTSLSVSFFTQTYLIPADSSRTLPWINLSGILPGFNNGASFLTLPDFSLVGTRYGNYLDGATLFYDSEQLVTIGLADPSVVGSESWVAVVGKTGDRLTLQVGDSSRSFDVLPGDYDGNGVVNLLDINSIRQITRAGGPYDQFADLNGDDVVDGADVSIAVRFAGSKKLDVSSPTVTSTIRASLVLNEAAGSTDRRGTRFVYGAGALPQGPEVAKLSPSAIWYPLGRLSRKRCSGTQGEQGETPAFAGLGTRNFPEEG